MSEKEKFRKEFHDEVVSNYDTWKESVAEIGSFILDDHRFNWLTKEQSKDYKELHELYCQVVDKLEDISRKEY